MFKNANKESFVQNGTQIFLTLEAAIRRYKPDADIGSLDIIDFGCGVGRVAIPFFHKYGRPSACVDLQANAIKYLARVLPGANPALSTQEPPLPFADGSF
jgi:hypothetical protein